MKCKFIYILVSAVVFLSSCNDWLEVSSSTQIKGDDLLSSESGFQEALTGIYLNIVSDDLYGKNLTWYSNELLAMPYDETNLTAQMYALYKHNYTSLTHTKSIIDGIWGKSYTTIAAINNLLKYVETDPYGVLSNDVRNLYKGELLALRAYIHLDLIRLYGRSDLANNQEDYTNRVTIPYVTKYSKDQTPQLTYKETMSLLIADLNNAIVALKNDPVTGASVDGVTNNSYWKNRKIHMNYYAAKATLARAYMWIGTADAIESAHTIAQEFLNYEGRAFDWITPQKLPISGNIDRTFSCEHLFSLNVYALDNKVNSYMTDLAYDEAATVPIIESYDLEYTIFNSHKYNDAGDYIPGGVGYDDYRYANHVRHTNYKESAYYMPFKLYQTKGMFNPNYNDIVPMIKISEMYYILVEYQLMKGDDDAALELLNKIRAKRGLTKEVTKEMLENDWSLEVKDELTKEYIREFIGEGQLFYYYKRKGLVNPLDLYSGVEFNEKIYLLPYPTDEVTIGNRVQ